MKTASISSMLFIILTTAVFLPAAFAQRDKEYLAKATSKSLKFSHINVEDGLSNNLVWNIIQDDNGFMWFGTWNGINRFDGYSITKYRSGNDIKEIIKDHNGNLWMASMEHGLIRYNRSTDGFSQYLSNPNDSNSISSNIIHSITKDASGILWISTEKGLDRFNPDTRTFKHFPLVGTNEGRIVIDRSGFVWLSVWGKGLFQFNPETEQFTLYKHDPKNPHSLSDNRIGDLYEDRSGTLWIGTEKGYLNKFDRKTGGFTRYQVVPKALEITFILEDSRNLLWLGTRGSGLGLAISRELVQLMGSEIKVSSQMGQGTTFWFDLDLPLAQSVPQAEIPVQRSVTGYKGPRRKILVVDDKYHNRRMLTDLLEPLGFELLEAENGQHAIEKARENEPHIVLMDLVMPIKTGFEAAKEIRQIPALQDITIIAISASVFDIGRGDSRLAECDAFLPKPVEIDKLFAHLEALLKLEWTYQAPLPDKTEDDTGPLIVPPPHELEALYELAVLGKISKISKHAAMIEQMDGKYKPFVRKLDQLVTGLKDRQIVAFIEQYLDLGAG